MHIKIQTSEKANGNKGSVNALASYLEKEDINNENKSFEKNELPEPRTGFFNHSKSGIFKNEVVRNIDTNKKALGKNDAKFYAITISPSENEQKHLLKHISGKEINSISELSRVERRAYEKVLLKYTRRTMNEYASHFERKNLKSGSQLVWYGKVEHHRFHRGTDLAVKNGLFTSGSEKKGLNTHIHIIVSRKDREQRLKLSPLATEKGKSNNSKLNGKKVKRGFDRSLFKIKSERLFDKNFNYPRPLNEKVEYQIEADKDPIKASEIKKIRDPAKKEELEKKLIHQYDFRNSYIDKDKELSQKVEPIIRKHNELEM